MPAFFTPPGTADRDRLHEAPVLAAHGYLLSAVDGADRSRVGAWSAAAARLRDRDPLPGDRASFFFRPIELLGIALGRRGYRWHDPELLAWLRRCSRRTIAPERGHWSVALNAMAAAALGDTRRRRTHRLPAGSAVDLAVLWLLATEAPDAAGSAGSATRRGAGDPAAVRMTHTSTPDTRHRRSRCHCTLAATSALRTGLARTSYGRPAALATITGMLRRFPAIVRELNRRHPAPATGRHQGRVRRPGRAARRPFRACSTTSATRRHTPSHAGLPAG